MLQYFVGATKTVSTQLGMVAPTSSNIMTSTPINMITPTPDGDH